MEDKSTPGGGAISWDRARSQNFSSPAQTHAFQEISVARILENFSFAQLRLSCSYLSKNLVIKPASGLLSFLLRLRYNVRSAEHHEKNLLKTQGGRDQVPRL
jgi:hypothetical protein